ncbi:enoyl-CoA hydratase/isomerase family protein [Paenibacillus alginolyticus]|uniref:enoyl-CoA hydratase/isomerase family protein n=1 Tax=Paenibacillus alginolyticus TaxID=59839 RepID=UPI000418393C|nr:enoyl-CoA hydratase/isomerase family protein [Paenibacillus alginolyticus]MCY9668387.1 enoyl-CoA hydratase/isomerase family protein [Paenibacillus alginolyticus]
MTSLEGLSLFPSYTYLRCEQINRVLIVTIQREEKLNAMNAVMQGEITDIFKRIHKLEDIGCVVLTGTGKGFMAGADIEGYSDFDMGQFFAFQDIGREMYRAVETCSKPVIAAVNGYALGGGFELTLACDLVVASSKASFGLPEVKLGLIPGGGGIQKISRIVGSFVAKELLMTGRFIPADEGRDLRFVNQVVEPEELLKSALEMATAIAEQAPLAIQILKKLVQEGRDASLETAQAYDRAFLANLFHSDDAKEGIAAFVAKRPPVFTGK